MATKRLFLALELPLEVKRDLLKIQEVLSRRLNLSSVKWVEKKNFHLSLLFLGKIEEERVIQLKTSLQKVKAEKFNLQIADLGFFPGEKKPRVVWVGLKGEAGKLKQLHQKIIGVLRDFNLEIDFRFLPHLTLGRVRKGQRVNFKKARKISQIIEKSLIFKVKEFVLMESKLSCRGSVYRTFARFSLN